MNSKSGRNIFSLERFRIIVEAYGANAEKWPVDERKAALALMETDLEAKNLLSAQHELDLQLDQSYQDKDNLDQLRLAILNSLPKQDTRTKPTIENLLEWFIPGDITSLWRPALAAILPLTIGITFGAQLSLSNSEDNWDQEFYLSAIIDTTITNEFILDNTETPKAETENDE